MHEPSEETDGVHLQEASLDQIKYDSPELESGKYYVVPFESLAGHRCKIIWKNDQSAEEQSVDDIYVPILGEQTMPDDDCQNWKIAVMMMSISP